MISYPTSQKRRAQMSAAASEEVQRDIHKDLLDAAVQIESHQGEIASIREKIITVKAELVKRTGSSS